LTPSREIANLIVVIRTAIESDLYPIVEFSKVCNKESSYGLPFNDSNAIDYNWSHIYNSGCDIILAEIDGKVAGLVMLAKSVEYHNKPFCYIMKFWVGLEGRKTRAARKLLESAVAWGRSEDCTHIFVTATAGLDSREQKLFINLVKKAGFVEGGPVLTLGLEV
tara:strand:- start:39 stop:530 length:492 start_codon:yes stop_codon:yes gene_type:complete